MKKFIVKLGSPWDADLGNMVHHRKDVVEAVKSAYGRLVEKRQGVDFFIGGVSSEASRFTVSLSEAWDADMGNMVYSHNDVINAIESVGGKVISL